MKSAFSLFFMHLLCLSFLNAYPILKISQGKLNGTIQESRNGRKFAAFLGIPYAQPPIKNLRFKNPLPVENWKGIRPADSFGNICPQIDSNGKIIGSEDCLFLNVYTPILEFNSESKNENKKLLPVMVWIHGGYFTGGSSDQFGGEYLLDKNVLLVTMNYRLGIFGFFSTRDSAATGNFGLKDQVVALKWVQKNIQAFGGDPNQVTIFGQSSGGACVALHALSKISDGLFQQYIIQSGSSLSPWAYQNSSKFISYAKGIAEIVGCPSDTSANLVHCLQESSVESLMDTDSVFDQQPNDRFVDLFRYKRETNIRAIK